MNRIQQSTQSLKKRIASRRRGRAGNSLIETVFAFQLLLFLSFGMVEFGQYFYIKHSFQAAARDGMRKAILPSTTYSAVTTAVTNTLLNQANVTFNSSWMTLTDTTTSTTITTDAQLQAVTATDTLQLQLSTTYNTIPNVCRPLYSITGKGIGNGKTITGTCTMLKE